MLRSLYSGISGLRSHQAMLDVTGNNIANVNTTAFKASAAQFQDTLSQMTSAGSAPQDLVGGTNSAQVGLGVQVAGISTNFAQGSTQATGKATDLMISGDGFFVTQLGGETLYTRAGSFDFDANGNLVAPDGALVQGFMADANGNIATGGATSTISLPVAALAPAAQTTVAAFVGNLPTDAESPVIRDIGVFDTDGARTTVSVTFTSSGDGVWTATSDGATSDAVLTADGEGGFDIVGGLTFDGIDVDLTALQSFAGENTVTSSGVDGNAAGTLESYTLGSDGTLTGVFSNGDQLALGRIALANFVNPGGLEKTGGSSYRETTNSGGAALGTAGVGGLGSLVAGSLEMSNVDLSQEFTNLIVAQRGFQANARIITTSDELLQEITSLKR
ncbi:flagellar hook protein FlgE [Cryobacterium frigoriphilum]|uniref:Flagellar hook protein FlgE n=1 Tax=Cryobacterium frigoriphilum TaxID=1259150 RepID=A0A4V6QI66_9MICO|nr:flagellar hook protein FlgE [Cryobacterium frigoriphilum]TFD47259.1 flagellar hook protein FlgE [Cryobacterium frigoriphilum]